MSNNPWVVIKFGGTSVRNRDSWQTIATIVQKTLKQKEKALIVCSALPGISDALEQLSAVAADGQHAAVLEQIFSAYDTFARECDLDVNKIIGDEMNALKKICEGIALTGEMTPTLHARLLAFGELMLTRLGAAFLNQQAIDCHWFDARDVLQSQPDPLHTPECDRLMARCDDAPDVDLQSKLKSFGAVCLTQGFIAKHPDGKTVLLGRGGSDASAAYFAAKVQAIRCEIWTDVPGIYTTNPKWVPEARLLKSLSYEEALEIAAAGAKVLHPKCIGPLMRNQIPCHIRCTHAPDRESTVITHEIPLAEPHVKAISKRGNVTLVVMETTGMWQQVGFLADVFACFKKHGISIDLVSTSEKNVTVSLDDSASVTDASLTALTDELSQYCCASVVHNTASISLVGRKIRAILYKLSSIFESFAEHKMYMLTQAANDLNLTVVIDEAQSEKMIQKLHALLFEKQSQCHFLGESWQARAEQDLMALDDWWIAKREQLTDLMQSNDALYIYDNDTIKKQIASCQSMSAIDQFFYAMKANSHPAVLKTVHAAGLGFECVSLGEVEIIRSLLPELPTNRILFTPNFAPLTEYQTALANGYYVTLDNTQPLIDNPDIFANQSIILRIDPGVGRGHHKYVITGGNQSKFGITVDELEQIKPLLKQHKIKVIGLHAHSGSGILTADNWHFVASFLLQTASDFPDIQLVNLGGGLGIPERFGELPLDMNAVNDSLTDIKSAHPKIQFWMEPGRYLVAQSGVLLARVTQLKQKQSIRYVGIATGMNSLIRPALYGSHHEIVNLSKLDAPRTLTANVVGPICESGDTLGYDRLLPETKVGDIMLINNAGAYGYCMSSHYNAREPAAESVI